MNIFATAGRVLHVLILGLWVGSCTLFLFLESTIERVVSSRHQVDAILTAVLAEIDFLGLLAGPALLLTLLIGWSVQHTPLRFRVICIFLMTALVGISGQWIAPQLVTAKDAMGRLEDMEPTHALMLEFERLSTGSTAVLLLHAFIALVLLVMAVRGTQPRRSFGIEL